MERRGGSGGKRLTMRPHICEPCMSDLDPSDFTERLVWALRALAQEAHEQMALYPDFVCFADELVSDFGEAYDGLPAEVRAEHPMLAGLEQLILSKSGILEYWTEDALRHAPFWVEIRETSRSILAAYGLPACPPGPSPNQYYTIRR